MYSSGRFSDADEEFTKEVEPLLLEKKSLVLLAKLSSHISSFLGCEI